MKQMIYLCFVAGLFLASCTPSQIPFKSVPNATAKQVWEYYYGTPPGADQGFKEAPKVIGMDKKTLKIITKKCDEIKTLRRLTYRVLPRTG